MKIRRDDMIVVIAGRDKGKTGKVLSVIPAVGKLIVENINISKRHTKPSQKNPRGGILDITKPLDVSKVMVIDPTTGKPARIGYTVKADGTKERIFKVSAAQAGKDKPKAKAPAKKTKETTPVDVEAEAVKK